jgi:hypothetical protein
VIPAGVVRAWFNYIPSDYFLCLIFMFILDYFLQQTESFGVFKRCDSYADVRSRSVRIQRIFLKQTTPLAPQK